MLCLIDSIRYDDPALQRLLSAVEEAHTLTELLLAVWPLARTLAVHIVESVLAERARRPTFWPRCPACGALLESKGFVTRQVTSLFGPIGWRRRVGRCRQGCVIGQVTPFDEELGLQPHQRTSGELQWLGCALAVFAPFATAARLLRWYSGGVVSPRAVWCWVQAAGHRAMDMLQAPLEAVAHGDLPPEEPLEAELTTAPLVMGADGVMVPFRPQGGQPTGKTSWREVKVAVLARLAPHLTRTGKVVTRLHHRRLVAVLGDIEALKPRLWLEALRQGILSAPPRWSGSVRAPGGCGACLTSVSRPMPQASWTFTTPYSSCGRQRPPGSMAAPAGRVGGSVGLGTACGMATPMGCWPTWPRPWTWRACPPPRMRP
jgi:hypothetical protein